MRRIGRIKCQDVIPINRAIAINIGFDNAETAEVDGVEGNDVFYILSTSENMVTTIIGGKGSDTFNVGGDVAGEIVSYDSVGRSGFINHGSISDDPLFDGIFVRGISLKVSDVEDGKVVISEFLGDTRVVEENGLFDSYEISIPSIVGVAYVNVSASRSSTADEKYGTDADSILLSTDGVKWFENLVLTVDDAASRTVYVRAAADTAEEGTRTVLINHSISSDNPDFDGLDIANVEVTVFDNDKADLIITEVEGNTTLVEGDSVGDQVLVQLSKQPTGTVTVSFANVDGQVAVPVALSFDALNWNTPQLVQLIAVDDALAENNMRSEVVFTATSGDTDYDGKTASLKAIVIDDDSGQVIITETDGSTLVSETQDDTYSIRLSREPSAPVVISLLPDGQTLLSSLDIRFNGAENTVTFDATNWNVDAVIEVSVNPDADTTDSAVQSFPVQSHTVNDIRGPLYIEGSVPAGNDRALAQAVMLPTETDEPLPVQDVATDESVQTDVLNVFNDGSIQADTGSLSADNISGLGMGGDLTLNRGTASVPDLVTYIGGINYAGIEVVDLLLGQDDDTFTVESTAAGVLTSVSGGGGSDTITVTGGGGAESPLMLFGDTSQDGSGYQSLVTEKAGTGREFANPGDDVIDASGSSAWVTIFGGLGNDTIIGSQAGDHLAGGFGDDIIDGQGGDDHIYGDSGFNVDLSSRLSLSSQVLTVVNKGDAVNDNPETCDPLTSPGNDTLAGGSGNDIILSDYGVIEQVADINRILTTGQIIQVSTSREDEGGDDTIEGNTGNDLILAGAGNDSIQDNAGDDVILSDNGRIEMTGEQIDFITTTSPVVGGNDTIDAGDGDKTILAGFGDDVVSAGVGAHDVLGDNGSITYVDGVASILTSSSPEIGGADDITLGDGDNSIIAGGGADTVTSSNGTDYILGDNGEIIFTDNVVQNVHSTDYGLGGNDQINTSDGDKVIIAADGSDIIATGEGDDILLGDHGTVEFVNGRPVTIVNATCDSGGDDTILGGNGDNKVIGGLGEDTVVTGAGDDFILGDNGQFSFGDDGVISRIESFLDAGGADDIDAGDGNNVVFGGVEGDTITTGAGNDITLGDNGVVEYADSVARSVETSDTSEATGDDDIFSLGAGNDIALAGVGSDSAEAGAGDDILLGDNGRVEIDGNGDPLLVVSGDPNFGGDDLLNGGDGNDLIIGGAMADSLDGGAGNDSLIGDAGRGTYLDGSLYQVETLDEDRFIGGDDTLIAGDGFDIMLGGFGYDTFYGDFSEDLMIGEYARVTLENDRAVSLVTLAQGKLDLIANRQFGLYVADAPLALFVDIGAVHDWSRRPEQEPLPKWKLSGFDDRVSHHGGATTGEGFIQDPQSEELPTDEQPDETLPEEQLPTEKGAVLPEERQPTPSEQEILDQSDDVEEESLPQNVQLDNLHSMVAGFAGWGVATGRRKSSKQRLASKDLHRFSHPEARNWRWEGGQMHKEGQRPQFGWDKPMANMAGFTVEKRERMFVRALVNVEVEQRNKSHNTGET